jgi:hypothetical protein
MSANDSKAVIRSIGGGKIRSGETPLQLDHALRLRDDALYDLACRWNVVNQGTRLAGNDAGDIEVSFALSGHPFGDHLIEELR